MPDDGALLEAYVRLRAKAAEGFEGEARDSVLPGLKRVAEDAAGVVAATKLWSFGKEGLDELKDSLAVAAQTTSAIKSTGGAANVTADQVGELAGSLSDLSGKDDELIQKGENLLLTFKGVKDQVGEGNNIFDRATAAALDLSVSGFGSMESASLQLGKALNDPIAGMSALSRSGVTFTEQQKATIKSLVDTGDTLSAQKIILGEVESQVGGAAKAYGETLPGQLERAKTSIDNTKAALVAGLAPAIETGADLVSALTAKFAEQPEILQQVEGGFLLVGGALGALARPANDVIQLVRTLRAAHEAATTAAEAQAVAEGSAGLAGSLAGLGLVAAPIVLTMGLLGKSYMDAQGDQAKAAQTVKDYTAALQEQNGVVQENIDKVTAQKLVDADVTGILAKAKIEASSFADEVRNGGRAAVDFANGVARIEPNTAATTDSIEKLTNATDPFSRSLIAAYKAGQLTWPEVRRLADTARDLSLNLADGTKSANDHASALGVVKDIAGPAAGATDELTTSLDDQAKALDAARTAAKNLADQYQSIIDGTLSQFEAEIALSDARLRGRDAVEALDKARREGKISAEDGLKLTNDTFSAILNEAKAAEGYAQAQATARGETLSAKDAQRALVEELYSVASTLAPGSDLQVQLSDYITNLQKAPDSVSTTFNLDTEDAVRALQDLQRQLAGIAPGANVDISFYGNKPGQAKAMGGTYTGDVIHGAEFGDELLLLNKGSGDYQVPPGGVVIPAPQTAEYLSNSSGEHFHQHLHFHDFVDPAKAARLAEREHSVSLSLRRR